MIRARVQIMGKPYEVGYFKTKAEAEAAKEATVKMFSLLYKPPTKHPIPSLPTIIQVAEMGRYDSHPEGLHEAALAFARRFNMVKEGRNAATPAIPKVSQEDVERLLAIG
jgi:hypothetical protein